MKRKTEYKYSDKVRHAMSIAHIGKKHSDETIKKIQVARLNQVDPRLGKKHSEESKEKMRIKKLGTAFHKGFKLSQESKDKIGKANSRPNPKNKEHRLHQIFPAKDTKIEIKIQQQLDSLGIKYKKHIPIAGQPDIYIADKNLLIFADGCFWHSCHECKLTESDKPLHKELRDQYHKDNHIKRTLELEGYQVCRIWEHEINKSDFQIMDIIERMVP